MLEQQAPLILTALRYLIIPIVFLFVYLLFLRPLQKAIFANWEPRPQLAAAAAGDLGGGMIQTPVSIEQLQEQLNSGQQPAQVGAGAPAAIGPNSVPPSSGDATLLLPSSTKDDVIRSRVIEHAKREPETVARLVRVWLNEEKP